jgi:hypothetical protein
VSLLSDANNQQVKRLLDSFPLAALKEAWPNVHGSKEEMCFAAAEERNIERLVSFMDTNIGRCRTHVYVLSRPPEHLDEMAAFPDAEVLASREGGKVLILTKAEFTVFLRDPIEEARVEFLWPMRMESHGNSLIVSFVVLERNPCTYYEDRDCIQLTRSTDERGIITNLERMGLQRADLHAGIKRLWEENLIDSFKTKYRKPTSTATEHMDEDLGIKQHNPELYGLLQTATLFGTHFSVDPKWDCNIEIFVADPSVGYLAFPRYSDNAGDADEVINRILEANH